MKILFIIALLSFAALAGAAYAITRHIRKNAATHRNDVVESDLSEALEARLSDISRSNIEARPQGSGQHDFSYFNKDASGEVHSDKSAMGASDPRPATADRSS